MSSVSVSVSGWRKKVLWALLFTGFLVVATMVCLPALRQLLPERIPSGPARKLALGGSTAEYNGLIWLAEDKGLFKQQNLLITHTLFDTGAPAVKELLAGRLDIVLASEFAFIAQATQLPELVVLGSIAKVRTLQVVALRERGIGVPKDIRGKRIGVPLGTSAEYALENFLLLNDLPPDVITIVPMGPAAMEAGLRDGKVDAVIVWEPNVQRLRRMLGERLTAFPAQKDRETFWCLVTTETILSRKSQAIEGFLRALVATEILAASEPSALRAGLVRNTKEGPEFVDTIRPLLQFKVSLEQALLVAIEEEGRWMLARGGGAPTDYRARVRPGPMLAVKPSAVTIIDLRGRR